MIIARGDSTLSWRISSSLVCCASSQVGKFTRTHVAANPTTATATGEGITNECQRLFDVIWTSYRSQARGKVRSR